ncbi:MAG: hypothetical protein ACRYFS_13615 [Janthinobacterium lividum]
MGVDLSLLLSGPYRPRAVTSACGQVTHQADASLEDMGQTKAMIAGDTIQLPYGSQGLYEKYTWGKGKFLKAQ